jgi:hypothetical protein
LMEQGVQIELCGATAEAVASRSWLELRVA